MIPLSKAFDLGLDRTRIKDPRDAQRQRATAEVLLDRLFQPSAHRRWELQILADEVGMGKTFVALAVAYSLLERLVAGDPPEGLDGCYQKVVILAPSNRSLRDKWYREVDEFVKRCVLPGRREDAKRWFKAVSCDRLDDFVVQLRRRGGGARILIAPMDIFGRKLRSYDAKRRFVLGALFRYWGNRFQLDRRERLLRGAPSDWPQRPYDLGALDDRDLEGIPCDEDEAVAVLGKLDRPRDGAPSEIEELLERCREMSEPYARGRDEWFRDEAGEALNKLYREVVLSLPQSPVPLVIVDEAHNWKNGPSSGANGYEPFAQHLASRTRRALLLTATPFQLRPQEMLELLEIGEALAPAGERSGLAERRERLRHHREDVLGRVLERSDRSSRRFARAWARLPPSAQASVSSVWASGPLASARGAIDALAARPGLAPEREIEDVVERAVAPVDPAARAFFADALRLYAHNRDLSSELGPLIVRHRRRTEHRDVRVGVEFAGSPAAPAARRPDAHVLHAAPGLDVSGEAELPHYLLMRCLSDVKEGRGRSSLGSALTGCYSTLLDSAEGRKIQDWIGKHANVAAHFGLLRALVDRDHDPRHPKVHVVVDRVLEAWRRGEKTLIFCLRTNTAQRLHEIIHHRIARELGNRRKQCLGGETSLRNLRGRLTRRDGDLLPLALDRVLWSFALTEGFGSGIVIPADAMRLSPEDLPELARVWLRHGIDLFAERVDRVFLSRAVEHVIAKRLLKRFDQGRAGAVLGAIASPAWVEWPYGGDCGAGEDEGAEGGDAYASRGVRAHYPVRREEPSASEVEALAARIEQRRARARATGDLPILDFDAEGPSLWSAGPPSAVPSAQRELVRRIHAHVAELTVAGDGLDWNARALAFEALRRALLRDSVLLRLLPTRTERDERAWGDLLVEAFWSPGEGQRESMAHRIEVFLEDLCSASGSFDDPASSRAALLDATKLRDQRLVALVTGGNQQNRDRVFQGFNSPLLPEVLVCTSVGAEGIDLHRHCRHVIHYDLAWNPAVLEQRTGRVDRIGSKTFRERELSRGQGETFLEVGVPFLAGTYDERIYEELRLRAQMFEVLTGGDVAADNAEGQDDDLEQAEGHEQGVRLVALPAAMVEDLRVRLEVWRDEGEPGAVASDAT